MQVHLNQQYIGAENRKSLYDIYIPENANKKLILFIHGYKGYKDWGCWSLVAESFAKKGYTFCKMNLSHNGGTVSNPIDFPDLEAFSRNTFSKQKYDVSVMLNLLHEKYPDYAICVVGHSMGGGLAILESNHPHLHAIVTWAGISSIAARFDFSNEFLEEWKSSGFRYEKNNRTKQDMPLAYEQYEDFKAHEKEFNIEKIAKKMKKPILFIHGDNDTSVDIEEGKKLAKWTGAKLTVIQDADHVFNSSEPWIKEQMPDSLKVVCEKTNQFLKSI